MFWLSFWVVLIESVIALLKALVPAWIKSPAAADPITQPTLVIVGNEVDFTTLAVAAVIPPIVAPIPIWLDPDLILLAKT